MPATGFPANVARVAETAPTVGVTLAPGRRAVLEEWAWRLAPVLAGLGALLLNLFLLGRRSLRFEEAQAIAAAGGSWGDLWSAVRDNEAPHALVDALLKGWIAFAGDGEWALRVPAALAGAVAVALTGALGARLFGRVAGLVAAGVLATNVAVLAWSQTARSESFAVAAVVLATLALVAALERPTGWRFGLWAAAAALAVAVSLLALPVVVAHAVACAVARPRADWRAPAAAAALVGAVALAVALLVATAAAGTITGGLPDGRELGFEMWRLAGWSPVPIALAAFGVFVLVTRRVEQAATWKTALLAAWLTAPVATGLLLALARSSFDTRYALTATPALALLAAAAVVSQHGRIELALVALLGLGAAVSLSAWYAGPGDEDWRGAVRAIQSGQQPGEAVIVVPARERVAADYYAGAGYTVDRPHGHKVWLLLAEDGATRRLRLARRLVRPPHYALLAERRYGNGLWLQIWSEP